MYAIINQLERIEKLLVERSYRGTGSPTREQRMIDIYENLPEDLRSVVDEIITTKREYNSRKIQRSFRQKLREKKPSTMYTIQPNRTSPVWDIILETPKTRRPTMPLTRDNFRLFLGIEFEARVENIDDEYRGYAEEAQWLMEDNENNRVTLRLQSVLVDERMNMSYTFQIRMTDNEFREQLIDVLPESLLISSMMSSENWPDQVRLDIRDCF